MINHKHLNDREVICLPIAQTLSGMEVTTSGLYHKVGKVFTWTELDTHLYKELMGIK